MRYKIEYRRQMFSTDWWYFIYVQKRWYSPWRLVDLFKTLGKAEERVKELASADNQVRYYDENGCMDAS